MNYDDKVFTLMSLMIGIANSSVFWYGYFEWRF